MWLAPLLCFTAEEAWLARYPSEDGSVHLELFPDVAEVLAQRGAGRGVGADQARAPRRHRRAGDRAGQQEDRLVAGGGAAGVHRRRRADGARSTDVDLAEVCITSGDRGDRRRAARRARSRSTDVPGVGVVPKPAEGKKCARSWRITKDVGQRS